MPRFSSILALVGVLELFVEAVFFMRYDIMIMSMPLSAYSGSKIWLQDLAPRDNEINFSCCNDPSSGVGTVTVIVDYLRMLYQ